MPALSVEEHISMNGSGRYPGFRLITPELPFPASRPVDMEPASPVTVAGTASALHRLPSSAWLAPPPKQLAACYPKVAEDAMLARPLDQAVGAILCHLQQAPQPLRYCVEPSPSYLSLLSPAELELRAERALRALEQCRLCPRRCGADRLADQLGSCGAGRFARVASAGPHLGEESVLVGRGGSGTIFFSSCNLSCVFCQNHDISQRALGPALPARALAEVMLDLQEQGCENINLVSPSHVVAQILEALVLAASDGLRLPLVYNTGGYDSRVALGLLEGAVDIYMPDLKYADEGTAERLSGVKGYVRHSRAAVREMHRQVGDLVLDERGVAVRGLLVRHLVLPEGLAGTAETASFINDEISGLTYVNVMDQYRPCYNAYSIPGLDRRLRLQEYEEALSVVKAAGLTRLVER